MSTTDTPNQSTSDGPLVPEIVEQLVLRDRGPTVFPHETPAHDTERDERLREAREMVAAARERNGDPQPWWPSSASRIDDALITLDAEVARLDAVVTAVRAEAESWTTVPGLTEEARYFRRALGARILRALDGGAS